MSFRYRERTVVDGEAIDPHDWNENFNSLVGELNGKLDRDNLPERVIDTPQINLNVFNTITQSTLTNTRSFSDESINDVHVKELDIEEDGVMTVHMGGTYSLNANFSDYATSIAAKEMVFVSCSINGTTVSNAPRLSCNYQTMSFYGVGTFPVIAGKVRVKISFRGQPNQAGTGLGLGFTYNVTTTSLTIVYKRR